MQRREGSKTAWTPSSGGPTTRFRDVSPTAELHGYPLDGGSDDWAPLKELPQARVDIFGRAIDALCEAQDMYLIRGGVRLNKVDWNKFVVEKMHREFASTDHVLTICDDVNEREKYRAAFAEMKRNGTGGNSPCDLRGFVDGLH